jgi:two-component system OmpR family sensor kinase
VSRLSLRARTLLALLVLTAIGLAASELTTTIALQHFLEGRIDEQLDREQRPAADMVEGRRPVTAQGAAPGHPPPPTAALRTALGRILPPGGYVAVVRPDHSIQLSYTAGESGKEGSGQPRPPSPWPQLQPGGSALATVPSTQAGAADYRLDIHRIADGRLIVVGQSLRDVDATVQQLGLSEALVSAAVLIAAAGLGAWLVRLGLRPLDQITATADAIAAGDLGRRAPGGDSRTEVGRLAAAFNAMLGQIQRSFAAQQASEDRLRRFLADASHELRTPLTSVRGYAELFRRGADRRPDDLAKVMSRIEEEAIRMGVLVDDLLLLARLDQRRPLERNRVDLREVVQAAVDNARVVEPDREIAFAADASPVVAGDAARLRQVIDNLLSNVRMHTPRGAPATVTLRRRGGLAEIEVRDSGPGIPREKAERVFERFYRADPARSRGHGGSGLGLSIVQAIVAAHSGTVELVQNGPGSSTFRITLEIA